VPKQYGTNRDVLGAGISFKLEIVLYLLESLSSPLPDGKNAWKRENGMEPPSKKNKNKTKHTHTHTHTHSSTFVKGKVQKFKNVSFPYLKASRIYIHAKNLESASMQE
jgi:hypothetical protein